MSLTDCDYDPTTFTFLTRDPLHGIDATPVTANPYHYADSGPLNKTDPLGLLTRRVGRDPSLETDPIRFARNSEFQYLPSGRSDWCVTARRRTHRCARSPLGCASTRRGSRSMR